MRCLRVAWRRNMQERVYIYEAAFVGVSNEQFNSIKMQNARNK